MHASVGSGGVNLIITTTVINSILHQKFTSNMWIVLQLQSQLVYAIATHAKPTFPKNFFQPTLSAFGCVHELRRLPFRVPRKQAYEGQAADSPTIQLPRLQFEHHRWCQKNAGLYQEQIRQQVYSGNESWVYGKSGKAAGVWVQRLSGAIFVAEGGEGIRRGASVVVSMLR